MTQWDTFSLFQSLLDEFPKYLAEATLLQSGNQEDSYPVKLAIVGFSRFRPFAEWNYSQYQIISNRINGDLADLSWFEECAEAVRLFSCLCLGAMQGKFAAGEIDEAGFILGEAHLSGFNVEHDPSICQQWRSAAIIAK